jgi:hypothetical protein
MVEFREVLGFAITAALLLGLLAIGIGILSWVFSIFTEFDMPWQAQVIVAGLIVLLLAAVTAKLFAPD